MCFSILARKTERIAGIRLDKAYLGVTVQTLEAAVIRDSGTAHLATGTDLNNAVQTTTVPAVLQTEQAFAHFMMIKIEADRFEAKILAGARDFLVNNKPEIFFEYDPHFLYQQGDDGLALLSYLQTLAYRGLLVYDNLGSYLFSADLEQRKLLEEITTFFWGQNGLRYCDLCAFHTEDHDLFVMARDREMQFFRRGKG